MNILDFLLKNPGSRKIFGKRELKIIEKQLLGINLTQSEKNRLSRDIRKKLEFIKELARFSEEFKLKKGESIKRKINEAVEIIKRDAIFSKVKRIVLFGSTATNERTFRSDIDIAVEFSNVGSEDASKFRSRILGNFDRDMDIQVYSMLPEKIKKEINKTGKLIYEQNSRKD